MITNLNPSTQIQMGNPGLIIAEDIAHTDMVMVTPNDDLEAARHKFAIQDMQLLPVVEPMSNNRIIGVLRYDDMMTIYNKRLIETLSE